MSRKFIWKYSVNGAFHGYHIEFEDVSLEAIPIDAETSGDQHEH